MAAKASIHLGIKQFRAEGCLSYLVYDPSQKIAALFDPVVESIEDYREILQDRGLKLKWILDTHTHADHFSASHLLRELHGSEIGMHYLTQNQRVTQKLKHGDVFSLGSVQVETLETPGHTPDSLCFYLPQYKMVLTGDTLLMGTAGRTDFPGASAAQLYDSLHQVLEKLPPETVVLPGHDYNQMIFSTLKNEKTKNAQYKILNQKEFTEAKNAECISGVTQDIKERVAFNLQKSPVTTDAIHIPGNAATACGISMPDTDRFAAISVDKYLPKLKEQSPTTRYIDVREVAEYQEMRMPGAENIPLSEVALHLDSLSKAKRIYVSCLSGRRSGMITKTLSYLGFPDVVNVSGGIKAWKAAGYPVE